jgi:2-keto-3-deoxy-6-phosphogluconate aldolase
MKISFDSGLVAILRTKTESDARDMANALVNAGIKLIEFTTTTPGALNLVEEFSSNTSIECWSWNRPY